MAAPILPAVLNPRPDTSRTMPDEGARANAHEADVKIKITGEVFPRRRAELLRDLVRRSRSVADLSKELSTYGWDSAEELVTVDRTHVITMFEEYTAAQHSASDVREWAKR